MAQRDAENGGGGGGGSVRVTFVLIINESTFMDCSQTKENRGTFIFHCHCTIHKLPFRSTLTPPRTHWAHTFIGAHNSLPFFTGHMATEDWVG